MRSTAALVARRALQLGAVPVPVSLLAAGALAFGTAQHGEDAAGAQSPWLLLPAFVAAAVACLAALEAWPTFARGRPGQDLVLRALGPGLAGCGAATLGATVALALWLAPVAVLGAAVAPPAHAHRQLAPHDRPVLDAEQRRIRFGGGGAHASAVLLRPVALVPLGAPEPTTIHVAVDGQRVTAEPLAVAGTRQLLRIPLDRAVDELRIESTGGSLTLLFLEDSVELVLADERSRIANALLACAPWLFAAAAALAFGALLAPFVALPVNAVAVLAALVLQSLGRLGPIEEGVLALLRGRWLVSEPWLWRRELTTAATAALALLVAHCLRRRLR